MNILEENNRNFIISSVIVIVTGFLTPIIALLTFNLGIIIQIPQYLVIWAICTLIPAVIFYYAKVRTKFQIKKFFIHTGFCFIPILISNIINPIIESGLAINLDNIFDINLIRQSTFNWVFQAGVFLYIVIPIIAFCTFIILLGFSMNKVYEISIEKSILISIPIVFTAIGISTLVGSLLLLLF